MASVLQVETIKPQDGAANAIEIANSSANVSIGNLTTTLSSTSTIPASIGGCEVLLDTHTANNDTATLEVDLTQYTTFETYRIRFVSWVPATDDKDFRMRVGTASNNMNTNRYRTSVHRGNFNGSSSSDGNSSSTSYLLFAYGVGAGATPTVHEGMCLESFIYEPRDSTKRTRSLGQINLFDVNSYTRIYNIAGTSLDEEDNPYWHFTWQSDVNTFSGKFYLYGIKNA